MAENLTELPEAVPLYRVSPAWRLVAIFACVVAVLAIIGWVSLSAVNHGLQMQLAGRPPNYAPPVGMPMPVPMPTGPAAVPAVPAAPEKPAGDPANLPYPIREDLRPSFGAVAADPQGTPRAR